MNRNRKPMGRKKCLKMMGVLLASAMVTAGTGGQAVYASGQDSHIEKSDKENKESVVIYLNGEKGSDKNAGTSAKTAVKTFRKAASLAGDEGKILICGTVTVDGEETWELPDGVSVRAAEGFSDPLVCVNGSLTLENVWMKESQITGDGQVEGAVKESLVKVPEVISIDQPVPLAEISLEDCEGEGTFSWEKEDEIPSAWETVYQVIFRPDDPEAEDYSQEEGWDEESGTVIRPVTVRVLSLEEAGEQDPGQDTTEKPETGDGSEEPADGTGSEAGTDTEIPDTDTGDDQVTDGSGEAETGSEPGDETDQAQPEDGEEGTGQESPEDGTDAGTPDAGEQPPADGSEEDTEGQDPVTDGEDGSSAGDEEDTDEAGDTEEPGAGSDQQPGDGADAPVQQPGDANGAPDNGAEVPDAGTVDDSPSGAENSQATEGLTAEEQQQAADVQARLDAVPGQAASLEDVNLVVEVTRAYLSLNDAQRELLKPETVRHLEELQQQAAVLNRSSGGVTIEGDFPWYIQFQAQRHSQEEQLALPGNAGVDTLIAPYDMRLWDLMNQQEYHLNGQQVRITMPAPDMAMFSQLVVLHYLDDGSVEYITPVNNGDGTISFLTTSFSPYNLAGSQVLVGNTNWLYTPAVSGGSSSGSSGSTQTSQSGSSSNRGGSTGSGSQTQTLTGSVSQTASSGSQSPSRVNRVVATNDPQNPLLYVGVGAAALIILAGAAVGVKKSAGRRKESEDTKE